MDEEVGYWSLCIEWNEESGQVLKTILQSIKISLLKAGLNLTRREKSSARL